MEMGSGTYAILRAGERDKARHGICALAVMAKAPRAGKVKTRLAPALGFEGSAAINVCFLRDTTRNIAEVVVRAHEDAVEDAAVAGAGALEMEALSFNVMNTATELELGDFGGMSLRAEGLRALAQNATTRGAAGLVCYTPVGDEAAFDGLLPEGFALIAQRGDAFGERLLAAAQDILSCGFGAVCLIDSDSPTMPQSALLQAVEELAKPGDRVVLGGSDDGGYYLIGLKQAHRAPFERITWSTELVYAETVERVKAAGLELVELPVWYDVDDAVTLRVLEEELLEGRKPAFAKELGYAAEATREFLRARRETGDAT